MSNSKKRLTSRWLVGAFLSVALPLSGNSYSQQPVSERGTVILSATKTSQPNQKFNISNSKDVDVGAMMNWRQDFHAHPEISYQEKRTAKKVKTLLQSWGLETYSNIGTTGVVGVLKGIGTEQSRPAICLRADMDALPLTEVNQKLSYASQSTGKMHACGHDGHTSMLLGAAKYLSETKNFSGTVSFIFQPAEEGGAGAKAMIDDGLFNIIKCDSIYGMHTWPSLPVGKMGIAEGNITSNSDRFTLKITGKGGHAAYPAHNIDVVALASELVTALHNYKAENITQEQGAVLAVTNIHGGEVLNAMPETLELGGTVRTFSTQTQDQIAEAIQYISNQLAKKYDASIEVNYKRGYPSVYNNPVQTQKARDAAISALGKEAVVSFNRTMAGEDFSYYTQYAPGAYVALGQWGGQSKKKRLHSPTFDFNDAVLKLGASYWVNLVEGELPKAKSAPQTKKTALLPPK